MKFLKPTPEPEPKEEPIKVVKIIPIQVQCSGCLEWSYMQGGPTGDGKAKYECGLCGVINEIKWSFDI